MCYYAINLVKLMLFPGSLSPAASDACRSRVSNGRFDTHAAVASMTPLRHVHVAGFAVGLLAVGAQADVSDHKYKIGDPVEVLAHKVRWERWRNGFCFRQMWVSGPRPW